MVGELQNQTRLRRYGVNAALIAVSAVVTLLIMEGAARLIDGRDLLTARNWVTQALESKTRTRTAEYDPLLGWHAIPNLNLVGDAALNPDAPDYSHLVVNTNDRGYRFTGAPGGLRHRDAAPILAVGDSFTWGSEVSDLDSYPARLQERLGWPVINASYGGWGTDQIWLRAQQVAEREHPSLVLISPLTNDVLRNAYRRYGRAFKPYFEQEKNGNLKLRNVPVPRNSSAPRDIGLAQWAFGRLYLSSFIADALGYKEIWINKNRLNDRIHGNEVAVEIACDLVHISKSWSEQHDIPIAYALLYSGGEIATGKRHWFTERYRKCILDAGLPLVDLWDALLEASASDAFPGSLYRVWKGGQVAHMNPKGNAFVADAIAHILEARSLLDPTTSRQPHE